MRSSALVLALLWLVSSTPAMAGNRPTETFWRLTAHVQSKQRMFHLTFTFFRYATPMRHRIMAAGYELTDDANKVFLAEQRLSRPTEALDEARDRPLRLRIGSWQLYDSASAASTQRLIVRGNDARIDLAIDDGVSPAATVAGRRLSIGGRARGTIVLHGVTFAVSGTCALEHVSNASDDAPSVGWSRLDLQFDDGRSFALYESFDGDDRLIARSGVLIDANGVAHMLASGEIDGPGWGGCGWIGASGHQYPSVWELVVKPWQLPLVLQATVAKQEVVPSIGGDAFSEAAVDVIDRNTDVRVGWGIASVRTAHKHAMPCAG